VYNTSQTVLSATLNSWQTSINIVPVAVGEPELWADSGYVTIEGELIYYASVHLDVNGKVDKLLECIRRTNGTTPRNYPVGTPVRGFVIAQHHNNLAQSIVNVENFVGTLTTTDQDTIYWKLQQIANLGPLTDDAGCPQIEFYYRVISTSPIEGTEISFSLNIIGNINNFLIDFGDGTTESTTQNGTHFYAPNKRIDPSVTVTTDECDCLQTSAERLRIDDLAQNTIAGQTTFPVIVPPIPDFPNLDLAVVNEVPNNIQFPPIVFPCLDIGPFGPIVVPSTISIVNPYPIPSVITFEDVPVFPSQIVITSSVVIPTRISIIGNLPSTLSVIGNIPSTISVVGIPSTINVVAPSNLNIGISVINTVPCTISVIGNIPSVIAIDDLSASLDVFLNSDYCTNCTGSTGCSNNGQTIQAITDIGCDPCAGANPKITRVTVVLHDFIVTTLDPANPESTRYDLVKVLIVAPDGTNCLVMGGAQTGATTFPDYTMNEPVTLTFADGSNNNIYDFTKPLETKTYAPNANGNNASYTAGQVNLGLPAPPPTGATGYGTNLAVFTDSKLQKGPWYAYISAGPRGGAYTNIVNVGKVCARVSSAQESPCDFPSPTPTSTSRVTQTPVATPRKTPLPTPLPSGSPAPTATPRPSPSATPFVPFDLPTPGPNVTPIIPPRPQPQPTPPPIPSGTPGPTPAPSATFTCGTCTYVPQLEDCGSGVCTYYWDGSSWGRCGECTSCGSAGENCGCQEARIMRAFNILPPNGEDNPDVNTNCYKVVWTDQSLTDCNGGFCTYSFNMTTKQWDYFPEDSFCSGTGDNACKCQDANKILVPAGILPPNPGTNETKHTNCYKVVNSLNNCTAGSCECPPAPTSQFITGSTQQLKLNCVPECGRCYNYWSVNKGAPCDPDPADYGCSYEYIDDGWERINNFCPCENFECLDADIAVSEGLLTPVGEQGEIVRLSCYQASWYHIDDCDPEIGDCRCPPTPTPPASGANAGKIYLEEACVHPTSTPTPTQGCGYCEYKWDPAACYTGGFCIYTYYAAVNGWERVSDCQGGCGCPSIEILVDGGILPVPSTDGTKVSMNCLPPPGPYAGNWSLWYNGCTTNDCKCPNETPPVQGQYNNQRWNLNCEIKTTPTPTPSASSGCDCSIVGSACGWQCQNSGGTYKWVKLQDGCNLFCAAGSCQCIPPSGPCSASTEGEVSQTKCTNIGTATPTPMPTTPPPTPSPSLGACLGCFLTWNYTTKTYDISGNNCLAAGCNGCYIPTAYQGQNITMPCANNPPESKCSSKPSESWPQYCTWECDGGGNWILTSQCAAGCDCPYPWLNLCNAFSDVVYELCRPAAPPVNFDGNTYVDEGLPLSNMSVNLDEPTISPPPRIIAEGVKVELVPVSRERVKLCKYAGRQPLEMVKQGCGACAVRTCEKFGLCSHSGVIEGRDDVYCCQMCDEYDSGQQVKIESSQSAEAPKSAAITTTNNSIETKSVEKINAPVASSKTLPKIIDPFTAADEYMKKSNMVKIAPVNLSIKVDVDNLIEGKNDTEQGG
jgi:hypothetical protein